MSQETKFMIVLTSMYTKSTKQLCIWIPELLITYLVNNAQTNHNLIYLPT